jgi:hypothetical protein
VVIDEGFTSYAVDNDRRFRDALARAYEQVGDLRLPFRLIAQDFYRSEKAIWQLSSPGQYPDLAESTKKDRRRRGQPLYPILRRSGALEAAATTQGGAGNITRVTKSTLELGVDGGAIPYAIFHQSDRPRRKIPLRKYLFIGPEAPRFANSDQKGRLNRWLGMLNGYVAERLEQLGQVSGTGGA